jgi:predicted amidophosphoribosyltransferase
MPLGRLLSLLAPPLCWSCGGSGAPHGPLCGPCRSALHWLDERPVEGAGLELWAPVAYEGPARALVGGLKFRGAAGLAEQMAAAMLARAPPGLVDNTTLVPVPLHPARLRRRGFNQAERLAAAMAARAFLPVGRRLARGGRRSAQVGRGRSGRLAAVRGSVSARGPVPPRALLVDDVITTGATLAACAEALREGGARQVAAIAYARTLGR